MTTKYHVFALPTYTDGFGSTSDLGFAESIQEALQICIDAGYSVIADDDGGSVDVFDAEDAPFIYSYREDGFGAISITVKAPTS